MNNIAINLWLAMGMLASVNLMAQPALQEVFKNDFLVGAALNPAQFYESNAVQAALVKRHFGSITPENVLKWERVHPLPGEYDFAAADRFVAFGEQHGMFIVGHTLVWHSQTPDWVFQDDQGKPLRREALLARMRDHIQTVVGRYKGRVNGWDVVNEALNDDGSLRDSPWKRIIGEDYIEKAFEFAAQADPAAELYYNDYSLENVAKRSGAVKLARKLQAAGVKITGIGTQQHIKMDWPSMQQVDETFTAFGNLGLKVMVTELDVDVLPSPSNDRSAEVSRRESAHAALDPYHTGLPAAIQQALARRYADLFAVYRQHRGTLTRVTFWGVTDGDSWLNDWPIAGRTAHPLLFDRQCKPKPAFDEVIKTAPASPANPAETKRATRLL